MAHSLNRLPVKVPDNQTQTNMNFLANSVYPQQQSFPWTFPQPSNVLEQSQQSLPPVAATQNLINHQWAQNIPTVMPWSNNQIFNQTDRFAFTSQQQKLSNPTTNKPTISIVTATDTSCDPSPTVSPLSPTNKTPNKRSLGHLMNDSVSNNEYEFDFDFERPIKKYVCEDKVLEIFDRLHIREGDHYIVEDAISHDSVKQQSTKNNNCQQTTLHIEELVDNNNDEPLLEFSPELKNVFQGQHQTITEKFIQAEKDKLTKALVIWRPNDTLTKLLSQNKEQQETNVQIEEVIDEDDKIEAEPISYPCQTNINKIHIEPYVEGTIQDQLMEP